ncbi:hypothetical protein [Paenibacillus sp. N3.4]|uniref:hypothetical protein n=1 Tax=Paenibacillus sp. N3.4 TaxID=2603222 RepID=UPI0011C6F75B|nr:hypothetical protein [Paenibacillus sp. N3.4]TXK73502.1 hypothetical protein FU659_30615 [Paenibacillus sp. N3.4]
MKNKFFLPLLLISLITMQIWFLYVAFHYEYYGVELKRNSQHEWRISSFQSESIRLKLGLQVGDMIVKVNDNDPDKNALFKKWAMLTQLDTITVSRNGFEFQVPLIDKAQSSFDYISLFGEILCFFISFLIFLKIPNSRSARFLSLVFLITGTIFMCIAPSARSDSMAKVMISSLLIILPLVFLHFLILFFKEKNAIQLPSRFLYYLYSIAVVTFIVRLSYLTPLDTYSLYLIDYFFVLLFFLFGLLLNIGMFLYVYFKYRRDNSSIQAIIKIVWFALFISCSPLVFLSFYPILLNDRPLLEPLYTGFFIIFFPISFSYLIVTKQLYDINLILRRILYTTLLSLFQALL